jgi:molecular chaperone GrpE
MSAPDRDTPPPDRETLLRRLAGRLEEALAAEDAPRGIPEEILRDGDAPPQGDLYAVQAALTALTQEVKLQGRSFKQLGEAVGPVAEMAPALASLIEDVRLQARREVLDGLLDLRDRLGRGEETAALAVAALAVAAPAGKTSWWRRVSDRERQRNAAIVEALREGYALTGAALDERLAAFGASEIECLGEAFDARRMNAIGVAETGDAEEGTVVEVCRRGYEWNGGVYRPAQVRVARRPGATESEES